MTDTPVSMAAIPGRMSPERYTLPEHAAEVMALIGFPYGADTASALWWRVEDDGSITLAAMCSDFFDYASADCERIEAADLPLLRQCLVDLRAIDCEEYLAELFAARKRRRCPMPMVLARWTNQALLALFEAIGERP